MKASIKQFLIPGVAIYAAVLIVVHFVIGDVHIVITGIGFATLLLGIAAMIGAIIKVREYMDRQDVLEAKQAEIETKLNGGLAAAAKEHMRLAELEAREAGDYVSLQELARDFERQRNDCLDKLEAIYKRLDETENGRSSNEGWEEERRNGNAPT